MSIIGGSAIPITTGHKGNMKYRMVDIWARILGRKNSRWEQWGVRKSCMGGN